MRKVEISYSNDDDIQIELIIKRIPSSMQYGPEKEILFAMQIFCDDDSLCSAYQEVIGLLQKKRTMLGASV